MAVQFRPVIVPGMIVLCVDFSDGDSLPCRRNPIAEAGDGAFDLCQVALASVPHRHGAGRS